MPKLTSVLLVDDDATNNFLNERLLQRLGLAEQVLVVGNGQEALALLQQSHATGVPAYPSVILLDIQMPIMNGIEFLQAYQQLAHQAATVVVLTTSMDARDLDRLSGLPAAGRINKPLTSDKLASVLQLHLSRQAARPDADC